MANGIKTTNTSGAISAATSATKSVDPAKTMKAYVTQMKGEIAKALPSVLTPERFTRVVTSALSSTPMLAQTTPQSFLGAMMTAAQLGLEPNTPLGQAYLIPYKNKGHMECQFQLGYKGLIDLAYRYGQVTSIQAHEVYQNDEFNFSFGLNPTLHHVPARGDRGETVYYYAVFHTKGGGFGFEVMSREDVESHARKYSKAYSTGYSPWSTNFDEMAKKTVLKKTLKYAPLGSDFVRAVSVDESLPSVVSNQGENGEVAIDVTYADVDEETGEIKSDL